MTGSAAPHRPGLSDGRAEASGGRINRSGVRSLAVSFLLIFVSFAGLLAAAGRTDWVNAWVYLGLVLGYQVVYTVVLTRVNPGMLNERGRFVKEGTKPFDVAFFVFYPVVTIGGLILMGFDARFGWSAVPWWASAAGVAVMLPSFAIGLWAMAVNSYFECTVRIQEDRGQVVCENGPYSIVRHPGYLALILSLAGTPLVLGSWWGFAPYMTAVAGVVARTALEDRTLEKELSGYIEYANRTLYRLVPYIW